MMNRKDIKWLVESIAGEERKLAGARFVAPSVRGGRVRTRVAGLVYAFSPAPADFEGWGVFEPVDATTARLVEAADLPLVDRYLALLKTRMRFVLVRRMGGRSWLAYPSNESDARQRGVGARPVVVHLVSDASGFEVVTARCDGAAWWFEATDRRADPLLAERLRDAMRELTPADAVRVKGLTPEMRVAYSISAETVREVRERDERKRTEHRIAEALRRGGGALVEFRDGEDVWVVEWTTGDGEPQYSVVTKDDLTVVSSGICLSGQDRDFDLQSLVGVIERA